MISDQRQRVQCPLVKLLGLAWRGAVMRPPALDEPLASNRVGVKPFEIMPLEMKSVAIKPFAVTPFPDEPPPQHSFS